MSGATHGFGCDQKIGQGRLSRLLRQVSILTDPTEHLASSPQNQLDQPVWCYNESFQHCERADILEMAESIKVMTVGDGAVGKTCLLMSYANDKFPEDYVPTVFDNYNCTMVYERRTISLGLWDTAGQDDYERLRPLAYPGTHVFLVCFSLMSHESLESVTTRWIPEITAHAPDTPIVLCGNKLDLREDQEYVLQMKQKGINPIDTAKGDALCRKIGASYYVECSAKTQKGIHDVFYKCVEAGLNPDRKPQPQEGDEDSNGEAEHTDRKSVV